MHGLPTHLAEMKSICWRELRMEPWEGLFHWVQLAESHKIFYSNTVTEIQYLNSKKAFDFGVSLWHSASAHG